MFIRLLFLLLLALNLGAAAWLLFGRAPERSFPPVTDPGVPALQLLSEIKPAAQAARATRQPAGDAPIAALPFPPSVPVPEWRTTIRPQVAVQPEPPSLQAVLQASAQAQASTEPPPAASIAPPQVALAASAAPPQVSPQTVCATLGPFTTAADMRAAMQALTPRVARIQYREEPVRRSRGYWVFLPAAASREAALAAARELAAKGIADYYVVTAGDTQNMISLGLFNDPANARKRVAQLQALGFAARSEQRVDTENAYWIDFAAPAGGAFDWQAVLPGRSDLQARAIDCF